MEDVVNGNGTAGKQAGEPGERVLELLREAASLYGRLESCAARQRALIAHDDMSPLLALLAERQRLSGELARVSSRLAPVRERWADYKRGLAPRVREEAEGLLEGIARHLRRAMELDEEDARLLSAKKQTVAHALRSTRSAQSAMSAYRGRSVGGAHSFQLDQES